MSKGLFVGVGKEVRREVNKSSRIAAPKRPVGSSAEDTNKEADERTLKHEPCTTLAEECGDWPWSQGDVVSSLAEVMNGARLGSPTEGEGAASKASIGYKPRPEVSSRLELEYGPDFGKEPSSGRGVSLIRYGSFTLSGPRFLFCTVYSHSRPDVRQLEHSLVESHLIFLLLQPSQAWWLIPDRDGLAFGPLFSDIAYLFDQR